MSILDNIESTIEEFELIDKNQTILVGISGGIDSVVLSHILKKLGYSLVLAHCNFKLRGKESDEDEDFVTEFAHSLEIELFKKTLPLSDSGKSTQEEARELRYTWFQELANKLGLSTIALAHNADDNFETALFHLVKGEGIFNQRGIPIQSDTIVRPLLFTTRKEILRYAEENHLQWRDDSSNQSSKYSRNYLRNEVIPLLKKLNESVQETYTRDYHRELDLREMILEELKKNQSWLTPGNEGYEIELEALKSLTGWFYRLEYFLKSFGYHSEQYTELKKFLNSRPGSVFILDNWKLEMDREKMGLVRNQENENLPVFFVESLPFSARLNKRDLEIKEEEFGKPQQNKEFLQIEKLSFPLSIRPWQHGDRFQPLGMQGQKKVSDFLIDEKISLHDKKNVYVLVSGQEIASILGIRISEKFKVEDPDKPTLSIFFPQGGSV